MLSSLQHQNINRQHPNQGARRPLPYDRNDNVSIAFHSNIVSNLTSIVYGILFVPQHHNNTGILIMRPTSGVFPRSPQSSPQQQAANAFLHQARMVAIFSRQPGVRGGPPAPPLPPGLSHQRGLIGSGPSPSHQWSIMGGPPRPPQHSGGCRNCGMHNAPGMPYCRNCRAPIHWWRKTVYQSLFLSFE